MLLLYRLIIIDYDNIINLNGFCFLKVKEGIWYEITDKFKIVLDVYFVLFKKFLIENSKLPKKLCTITITQEEYENLIKLKSEPPKSTIIATISDS